jgi:hypothetical protein
MSECGHLVFGCDVVTVANSSLSNEPEDEELVDAVYTSPTCRALQAE